VISTRCTGPEAAVAAAAGGRAAGEGADAGADAEAEAEADADADADADAGAAEAGAGGADAAAAGADAAAAGAEAAASGAAVPWAREGGLTAAAAHASPRAHAHSRTANRMRSILRDAFAGADPGNHGFAKLHRRPRRAGGIACSVASATDDRQACHAPHPGMGGVDHPAGNTARPPRIGSTAMRPAPSA
jgi:hypothetical protein